ncbi:ATP-dependent helicase HrpB [Microbacterium barkeri]|uniref:ATP-dependent helicase HrpB n=1 Tax=Microbacterium barkeri TaxID=33917 RepID=A0A9W6H1R8_9MICO|nr:ATP-dependent helicase HrpB [Microbacterium barkeri]MDR6875304.1 ATP-dependent helicase HrpB [Microbacterium barkeri]GLJ60533.1 ATP-dependent helicase HrpB [Microbacterium barkeri]
MADPHRFDLAALGAGLTVSTARDALLSAARHGAFVVTAPPGTGKTTFVPPLLANAVEGRVLVTQPRRVAVRAAARRIAQLDGSELGGPVGFSVRGEREVGPRTRIELLTPGVLLRRLLADPGLDGVDAVILDEVHERSLDGDLLLGMLAEARALRDDLVVTAMSATLDADAVARLLGGADHPAPVVDVPSPLHPLAIEYAPGDAPRLDERGVTRAHLAHLARVATAAQREDGCDALVFVPSARNVDELVRLIRDRAADIEVLPLHGRLPAREQDRATQGRRAGEPPRIVVSTALAESSLTVPGVRLVVDAGLSREVRRDRGRDMTGLVTVSASRASADQRAGRAARQGPGRAVRAYAEVDFARMPAAAAPEIASADLVDAMLLAGAWGTPGGEGLALLTPPPRAAVAQALSVLHALELTDASGRPTDLGRRIAPLPVGAREARALLEGAAMLGDARAAAEVVAAISDDHRDADADLGRMLRELRDGRGPGAARWRGETTRLARIAASDAAPRGSGSGPSAPGGSDPGPSAPGASAPGAVVALARPDWIARRTGPHDRTYLLASGTRAALPPGSALSASEWLAVWEVQRAEGRAAEGTGAVIRMAAALAEEDALAIGAGLTSDERAARIEGGRVRVRRTRRLGAILLAETPVAATPEDVGPAFAAHVRERGIDALAWRPEALALRARLALVHREIGRPWPDVDDASLLARIDDWLGPDLSRLRADASLHGIDVEAALRRLLPWPEAARLDELVPERLAVPSGSRVRIDYAGDVGARPVVAVKLQEVFGLAQTPRLVEGRVPVLFHLLSPARRPLAVTDDLASFWNGPYQQVRREMRGRYPRHPWPEDPWTAPATAKTNRAAGR